MIGFDKVSILRTLVVTVCICTSLIFIEAYGAQETTVAVPVTLEQKILNAEKALKRAQALYDMQAISKASLEQAKINLEEAKKGELDLDYNLGMDYLLGTLGTPIDLKKAKHHFSLSAQSGHAGSMLQLSRLVASDNEAREWLRMAAEQGNGLAMLAIAHYHAFGLKGFVKNIDKARDWLKKANSTNVKKELKEKTRLKIDGVERNQYNQLGFDYKNGTNGKARDLKKSRHYFELGAKAGHPSSMIQLSRLVGNKEKRKLLFMAAELGKPVAMFEISLFYTMGGYGFEHNPSLAKEWYKKAQASNPHKSSVKLYGSKIAEASPLPRAYWLDRLSRSYQLGIYGYDRDTNKSTEVHRERMKYLNQEAESGNPHAMAWLAYLNFS